MLTTKLKGQLQRTTKYNSGLNNYVRLIKRAIGEICYNGFEKDFYSGLSAWKSLRKALNQDIVGR